MKNLIQAAVVTLFAASTVQAQGAVQWKVSDGGNGHWYQLELSPMGWSVARSAALAKGGDLASLESDAEFNWVRVTIPGHPWPSEGCHLGGSQAPSSPSPDAGWSWLTGVPITLNVTLDVDDNPCGQGCCGENNEQNNLHSYEYWQKLGDANEGAFSTSCPSSTTAYASLIEWDADCNSDGVVDYGQILQGQLADNDVDGIPDICQQPTCVDADLFRDLNVNGADLGILLSQWGPNSQFTVSDINKDGFVNGADLGVMLSFWGVCSE